MSDFSATDVAFSGFRFVRRHPKTLAIWAAIQLVISVVFGALITVIAGPGMMQLQQMQAERLQGARPDPGAAMAVLHQLAPIYLILIPFFLVFYPMLYAAMSRAGLAGGQDRFAFLRLGADEGRQLLLILLMGVVGVGFEIVWLIASVLLGLVAGLVLHTAGIGVFVGVVAGLCAGLFFLVRLSLAFPLTFDSRRVNLFGSWTLTRGHFWKILGTLLLVLALGFAMMLLLAILNVVLILVAGGGLHGLASAFRPDMSSLGAYFAPVRIVIMVIGAGVNAVMWPLLLLPPVEIYKAVRP